MQKKVIAVYFRELRKGNHLTQQSLADAADVSKRTVERLETGKESVSFSSVELIRASLGAPSDDVNYLARHPSATPTEASELAQLFLQHHPKWGIKAEQLRLQDPHLLGIQTYVRIMRERQNISRKMLADLLGIGIVALANWEDGRGDALPFPVMVRAIRHIHGSLEDLEQIGAATDGQVALGHRLAEARVAFTRQDVDQVALDNATKALPQDGTMLQRLAAIESVVQFIMNMLKRAFPTQAPDIDRIVSQWIQNILPEDEAYSVLQHNEQ